MRLYHFAFLALAVSVVGCNTDNSASTTPVTQHYTATYNVTSATTEMRATFFHNPNNSMLPDGYGITCNGISLNMYVENNSTYYTTTTAGNPDALFELRTANGTILENSMYANVIPMIDFDSAFLPGSISRTDTLIIPFSGGPLTSGVTVTVSITQDAVHYTYHHEQIAIGDSVIVFLPNDLNPLLTGPATITLSRIGPIWPLGETDPGGGGEMRYTVMATRTVTISN